LNTNRLIPLLPDLAIFVTVVEQGNFSKAAKLLGVTPSAVSRQISRLEDALALKLLERTTRKLALTESGKITFNYGKQMLDSADQAVSASSSVNSTPTGLLRIAAPKSLANQVLRPLLVEFSKKYPTIKLHLKITDRVLEPIHDSIDILIHINEKPIDSLVNIKLGRVEQIVCASPHFLAQNGTPTHPEQLKDVSCICLGENVTDNRWRFTKDNQHCTVEVNGNYLVNHSVMRLDAIEQSLGIGSLPDYVAKQAIHDGTLIPILEGWQHQGNYQGDICLQFLQSKYMPSKIRVFIDFIKGKMS